ncbi:UvrD-helicase domain-containing protein [Gelidibacter sp. F2691]|nr:UvrD-helicase domain-containing protein [Gelidibacter sp. F2691]
MNKYIIAGAGSGKTTHLVNESIKNSDKRILITTYTEANEEEIRRKFTKLNNGIPNNVTIQTWYSFLLKDWVKPFQGSFNELLFDYEIKGMLLVNSASGIKYSFEQYGKTINVGYSEKEEFLKHYFTSTRKIYSDKISKFSYNANSKANSAIINRLSLLYDKIYIDEVQDLAGYDLELIKLLFKSKMEIELVGDPRQVTYLTHNSDKNKKYVHGDLKGFLLEKCKSLIKDNIDEDLLNKSHRNNNLICAFSSKLYLKFKATEPCDCCHNEIVDHIGVFIIKKEDVSGYLLKYNPIQLKWDSRVSVNQEYQSFNFGESKGLTYERVLIYPTDAMINWIKDNRSKLEPSTRAKFYVGVTRAKYSVAIVYDYNDNEIKDCVKY